MKILIISAKKHRINNVIFLMFKTNAITNLRLNHQLNIFRLPKNVQHKKM